MAEERVQRRLAAIMAADVGRYSRLTGADEATNDQSNDRKCTTLIRRQPEILVFH